MQSHSMLRTSLPLALLEAVKEARASPSAVATRLAARLPRFVGNDYRDPHRSSGSVIVKKEGKAAVTEAISFLSRQSPQDFSTVTNEGMNLAAADHAIDLGKSGGVGHTGRDASSPSVRLERYGNWLVANGEVLWFGRLFPANESPSAEEVKEQARVIVEDLIIDDGVADRGHRLCIYSSRFSVGGAAVATHVVFGHCAAIEFAGGWEEHEGEGALAERTTARIARLALCDGPSSSSSGGLELQTQWGTELGTCVACGRGIKGGTVVSADKLGGKLHEGCFVCGCCGDLKAGECCGRSLQGASFHLVRGSAAVCRGCWEQSHSPLCALCNQRITDGRVARDKGGTDDFHPECWARRLGSRVVQPSVAAAPAMGGLGALGALSSAGKGFAGLVAASQQKQAKSGPGPTSGGGATKPVPKPPTIVKKPAEKKK